MASSAEKEQAMFSMIESWQESGESQQTFAKSQEISYSTFQYWMKRYRQSKAVATDGVAFVPVKVGTSDMPFVELIFASGTRMNFYQHVEVSVLKSLVA